MNRMTALLVVLGVLLLPTLPLNPPVRGAGACNLVNAFTDRTSDFHQYEFVTVISDDDESTQNCDGTLSDRYSYTINSSSCQPGFGSSSYHIWGNGLSGTYRIDVIEAGGCLKLCPCQ